MDYRSKKPRKNKGTDQPCACKSVYTNWVCDASIPDLAGKTESATRRRYYHAVLCYLPKFLFQAFWEKLGKVWKSWSKLEKAGGSLRKLGQAGESWGKLGQAGESRGKFGKVGASWGKFGKVRAIWGKLEKVWESWGNLGKVWEKLAKARES